MTLYLDTLTDEELLVYVLQQDKLTPLEIQLAKRLINQIDSTTKPQNNEDWVNETAE